VHEENLLPLAASINREAVRHTPRQPARGSAGRWPIVAGGGGGGTN